MQFKHSFSCFRAARTFAGFCLITGAFWISGMSSLSAQTTNVTSSFDLSTCQFSPSGGNAFWSLRPGRRHVLRGFEDLESVEVQITVLDQTRDLIIPSPSGPRTIHTRIIEEREWIDSELVEVSSNYFARCIQTSDIYYFGEEVDIYEGGVITSHDGAWLAGTNGASAGVVMPGQFLLGSRYAQEVAPGIAEDRAEHTASEVLVATPLGIFTDCVEIVETTALDPLADPSVKIYARNLGLVQDDGLLLEELELDVLGVFPSGCTFSPWSDHPYFPMIPGTEWVYFGMDGTNVELVSTLVLEDIKTITFDIGGEVFSVDTRVTESVRSINGEWVSVTSNYYARCLEYGDLYCFGQDVDRLQNGQVMDHVGSWMAGSGGAIPGLFLPGEVHAGTVFPREQAPGVVESSAQITAVDVPVGVAAGTYSACIQVAVTPVGSPFEPPRIQHFAPGIGWVTEGHLELQGVVSPNQPDPDALAITGIVPAMLLTWPLVEGEVEVERSLDLVNWAPTSVVPHQVDDHLEATVPASRAKAYYRLVRISP